MKIKNITSSEYDGLVHNIEVEENHTYFAQNILVHNCYQGSTHHGEHAKYTDVTSILYTASKLKVFEVAFGGGEPTAHPNFAEILKTARDAGIVPNFTTRSLAWLRDREQWQPIMDAAGGFAYSVHKSREIEKLAALLITNGIDKSRVNLHLVLGTINRDDFRSILSEASRHQFRVTLLGYKQVGLGAEFKPVDYKWWLPEITKLQEARRLPYVSIDTVLAAQFQDEIEAADVSQLSYFTKDGSFSGYFDAVSNKFGPSSYEPDRMVDMPEFNYQDKPDQWLIDTFATFAKEE